MSSLATRVHNGADILDSRDIIARIAELTDEIDTQQDEVDDDLVNELKVLEALAEEASSSPDWTHGEALIRDSYFEEYARELADDIVGTDKNASWPNTFIDWEAAADALQQDYFSVEFDDVTYWIRN